MIKKLSLVVLVVIVLFVGVGFLLPGSYEVVRSTSIAAGPDAIYAPLSDLKTWPAWTAWSAAADPDCEWTYSGADSGAGARTSWEGPVLGQGDLELSKADPTRGIHYNISFDQGAYRGQGNVLLEADGANTKVTWTARGALGRNPINRYVGLFMDSILGPDLEASLTGLENAVPTGSTPAPADADPGTGD